MRPHLEGAPQKFLIKLSLFSLIYFRTPIFQYQRRDAPPWQTSKRARHIARRDPMQANKPVSPPLGRSPLFCLLFLCLFYRGAMRRGGKGITVRTMSRPRRTRTDTRPASVRRVGVARALSKLGVASRTVAAAWVRAGRVSLNGRPVCNPEQPMVIGRDELRIDGVAEQTREKSKHKHNKPRGLVTTRHDEQGRDTVYSGRPAGRAAGRAPGGRRGGAGGGRRGV